jgi:hypothetical protein
MRTLAVNEIEEVGGGPAVVLAPWVVKGLQMVGAAFALGIAAGAGEEIGSIAVQNATGTSCPKPTG